MGMKGGEAKQGNMFDRAFSRTFLGLTWIEIGERIGMGFARVGCEGANGESLSGVREADGSRNSGE
jgi:hypothetical protein